MPVFDDGFLKMRLDDQLYYIMEEMPRYKSDKNVIGQSMLMALYDTINSNMAPMPSYLLKDTMLIIALIINGEAPTSTDIENRLRQIQAYGFSSTDLNSIARSVYFLGKAASDIKQSRFTNISMALYHVMECSLLNKEYFLECIRERLPPKIIFRK